MDTETRLAVACYITLTVAGVGLALYAVWFGERTRRDMRAALANVPRSVFDPAEQL